MGIASPQVAALRMRSSCSGLVEVTVFAVTERHNSLLRLAEHWLDGTDDPDATADLDLVSDLERLWPVEVTGRTDRFPLPELVSVLRQYL
jgi:hypothetical protein